MESGLQSHSWKIYHFRRCYPRNVYALTAHASILKTGSIPHKPHIHNEEELIVILSGSVQIQTLDDNDKLITSIPIGSASIVYHDSKKPHTIHSVGSEPAIYVCLKWTGRRTNQKAAFLESSIFLPKYEDEKGSSPFRINKIFQSPTEFLTKLRCHVSLMEPGAGYAPHRDPHDILIVLLDGTVETLGQTIGPQGIIFYHAGEPHGMRNVGNTLARYVVFEFHRRGNLLKTYWNLVRPARILVTRPYRSIFRKNRLLTSIFCICSFPG